MGHFNGAIVQNVKEIMIYLGYEELRILNYINVDTTDNFATIVGILQPCKCEILILVEAANIPPFIKRWCTSM